MDPTGLELGMVKNLTREQTQHAYNQGKVLFAMHEISGWCIPGHEKLEMPGEFCWIQVDDLNIQSVTQYNLCYGFFILL